MFDTMDLTHVSADAPVWERAVRKLRGGMMPPLGAQRPDPAASARSSRGWKTRSMPARPPIPIRDASVRIA